MKKAKFEILSYSEEDFIGELPICFYVYLIKYLDYSDVLIKLTLLNKKLSNLVRSENYILYKHFLRTFNILNDRMKRADIPARVDIA